MPLLSPSFWLHSNNSLEVFTGFGRPGEEGLSLPQAGLRMQEVFGAVRPSVTSGRHPVSSPGSLASSSSMLAVRPVGVGGTSAHCQCFTLVSMKLTGLQGLSKFQEASPSNYCLHF